jgi:hypothetical protein
VLAPGDSFTSEEAAVAAGPRWLRRWARAAISEFFGGMAETAPVLAVRARAGRDANVGESGGSTQQQAP